LCFLSFQKKVLGGLRKEVLPEDPGEKKMLIYQAEFWLARGGCNVIHIFGNKKQKKSKGITCNVSQELLVFFVWVVSPVRNES
jgi:hypothetical protein